MTDDKFAERVERDTERLIARLHKALPDLRPPHVLRTHRHNPGTGEIAVSVTVDGVTYAEDPEQDRALVAMRPVDGAWAEVARIEEDGTLGRWERRRRPPWQQAATN